MDKKMMMAWLQAQAQKQQPTTAQMVQKRQGIIPMASNKTQMGYPAVQAAVGMRADQTTPRQPSEIYEQLSAEEEAYAKSHKSMLKNMIDQYGKEKGTRVFYASVRNAVKNKKD